MIRIAILLLGITANACVAVAQPASVLEHASRIDQLVEDRLEQIGQDGRPEIDDYTFCRRVYLDAIGRIPTLDELDGFVEDQKPSKRARLIEELLDSKGYQSHWYNYWADLLRVKYVGDKLHHPGNYAQWIKQSVRTNKPYDQMVHELVNASGPLYEPGNGATGFYAREAMPLDHLANSVKTFLGLSIECAQCHDHPFDVWTQKDFYKLAAFTSRTYLRVDPTPDLEKDYASDRKILKNRSFDEWIVYRESLRVKHAAIHGNGTGFMRLPHDYQYEDGKPFEVVKADVLFGKMPDLDHKLTKDKLDTLGRKNFGPPINSRESLADWIVSPDNPLFTKSIVNRLWHQVMGTELVGPLGDLTVDQMGPHPELTDQMIVVMKDSRYDLRRFLSVLFNSRTYQSKAIALDPNASDYGFDGQSCEGSQLKPSSTHFSVLKLRLLINSFRRNSSGMALRISTKNRRRWTFRILSAIRLTDRVVVHSRGVRKLQPSSVMARLVRKSCGESLVTVIRTVRMKSPCCLASQTVN